MSSTTINSAQGDIRERMAGLAEGRRHERRRDAVIAGTAIAAILAILAALLLTSPTRAFAATRGELEGRLQTAQRALDGAKAKEERLVEEIEQVDDRIDEIAERLPDVVEDESDLMSELLGDGLVGPSPDASPLDMAVGADDALSQALMSDDMPPTDLEEMGELADEALRHVEENADRRDALEDVRSEVSDKEEEVEDAQARLDRVRNAPPALPGCEEIDWSKSDDEIVEEWAPRIDAFLAGHALAGHGEDFVRAGIKYGVDPRFAASISRTESTMGDACFQPYNAFGYMGSSGYGSFTDSIYDISSYLAGPLYHGRLDAATAQTYCPPTWDSWLSNTLGGAQSI